MVFALLACAAAIWWVLGREVAEEPDLVGGSLKPRGVDSFWIYEVHDFMEDGSVVVEGQNRERVIEHRNVDGRRLQLIELESGQGDDSYVEYIWEFEDESGIHYWLDHNDPPQLPSDWSLFDLYFPLNVPIGKKIETSSGYTELLAINVQVTVPAGRFIGNTAQSTYYEDGNPDFRERYTLAPGIGLVQYEYDVWMDGEWRLESRELLRSFETTPE